MIGTTPVGFYPNTLLVNAGDEPTLIINLDQNNTLLLVDDYGGTPGNPSKTHPVPPGGAVPVSGRKAVYACTQSPNTVIQVGLIESGLNFFSSVISAINGNLIATSVQSPNFVQGVSGWQVTKTGDAEFNNLTIRGTFLGTDFIINAAGAFFYNGTPALGNLVISITSASGVDQFGNAYDADLTTYVTITTPIQSSGTWAIDLGTTPQPFTGVPLPGIAFQNQSHPFNSPPNIVAAGGNGTGTGSELELSSGSRLAGGQQSAIVLQDSEVAGITGGFIQSTSGEFQALIDCAGTYSSAMLMKPDGNNVPLTQLQYLELLTQPITPAGVSGSAVVTTDTVGMPVTRADTASSDTNLYHLGHFTSFSTTDEPIASATFATVCGGGASVGPRKYRVKAAVTWQQGATNQAQQFRLGFTGTISQVQATTTHVQLSVAAGQSVFGIRVTGNNNVLTMPTYVAGAIVKTEINAIIICTSSGTLSVQAAAPVPANPFTVLALSIFHVEPIG